MNSFIRLLKALQVRHQKVQIRSPKPYLLTVLDVAGDILEHKVKVRPVPSAVRVEHDVSLLGPVVIQDSRRHLPGRLTHSRPEAYEG